MSSYIGLFCSICMEDYSVSDVVYATSCGHLYHNNCLESAKANSTGSWKCPCCRQEIPNTFRIYLNLKQSIDHVAVNRELTAQLEENKRILAAMSKHIKTMEKSLMALQRKYDEREHHFQLQMDEKVKELNAWKNGQVKNKCTETEQTKDNAEKINRKNPLTNFYNEVLLSEAAITDLYNAAKELTSYGYSAMHKFRKTVIAKYDIFQEHIVIRDKSQIPFVIQFHTRNPNCTKTQFLVFANVLANM